MNTITAMKVTQSRVVPNLGKRIEDARRASGRPLTQLAAAAGISVSHWHRVENEQIRDLPIDTLRGIEQALGVDLGVEF